MRQSANVTEHRVWDLPTRLFHWSLVICVALLLATGLLGGDQWYASHVLTGYCISLLLLLRLVWWVFGTGYSRLSSLFRAITGLPGFVKGLLHLRPPHYAGHNPAGSVMILMLMTALLAIAASGFMIEGGEEKRGIFAGLLSFATGDAAHQAHAILAYALIGLVMFHLAGVLFETRVQHMPLVRGMVTGNLPVTPGMPGWDERRARPLAATISIAVLASAITYPVTRLMALPPLGVPPKVINATYETECSACHMAFPSTLLPRASWEKLMASLGDHFGEDATLPDATTAEISAFLQANASETTDSEPANRLRTVSSEAPFTITQTPYWLLKHRGITAETFKRAPITSKSNCQACHRDAALGRFDDSQISIPPLNP